MELDNETCWIAKASDAGHEFAAKCRTLCDENPSNHQDPLEHIMFDLVAELFDHRFTQSEIRHAFQSALNDLPRYAAGEDRRG